MPQKPICFKSRPSAQQQAENCCHDCPHQELCFREAANDSTIRELLCALEYLRRVCEHAEGKKRVDRERLTMAMRVGSKVGFKHRSKIPDYQRDSYWVDVDSLPESLGLAYAAK
jgi:hypothetical protein